MSRWRPRIVTRVHELVSERKLRFTHKALCEMSGLGLGLDEWDACEILRTLSGNDLVDRVASDLTAEWMYVFKPRIAETVVYLKLILRTDCVVISFHEAGDADDL